MDSLFGPPEDIFPGSENVQFPNFSGAGFDIAEAWWLAELCRLAYTPDSKEFTRVWHARKPDRLEVLEERSPFRELLDVHKTGNSAAIYETDFGGTVLCFRGTSKPAQWISNLVFHPHEWVRFKEQEELQGAFVHSGFYVMFKRIWPLLWPTLRLAPRPWIFTGHSLGGALAKMAHAVAKADKVYTFGAPRIGNEIFAGAHMENTIRIVNHRDIVPLLPARDESKGRKAFGHGGELVLLPEEGGFIDDPTPYLNLQPWNLVEEWSRQSDLFRHTPPWIKDHFIGDYCRKIAERLPPADS